MPKQKVSTLKYDFAFDFHQHFKILDKDIKKKTERDCPISSRPFPMQLHHLIRKKNICLKILQELECPKPVTAVRSGHNYHTLILMTILS